MKGFWKQFGMRMLRVGVAGVGGHFLGPEAGQIFGVAAGALATGSTQIGGMAAIAGAGKAVRYLFPNRTWSHLLPF